VIRDASAKLSSKRASHPLEAGRAFSILLFVRNITRKARHRKTRLSLEEQVRLHSDPQVAVRQSLP